MHPAAVVLIGTFALAGLLFIALGIPLWQDRVKPNALYGFRLPATLKDRDTWYRTNRVTGRDMTLLGSLLVVLALLAWIAGWGPRQIIWPMVIVMHGGIIVMLIDGFAALRRTDLPGAPPDDADPPVDRNHRR
ncbi:MAG TPA: SdpI family protein, partial [bacterium]|nr:SdpI family protein [bacterium]